MSFFSGWYLKYFWCHTTSAATERAPSPPVSLEMGPQIMVVGTCHQYYPVFDTWKGREYKIKSDSTLTIGKDDFKLDTVEWHKIRIGRDALQPIGIKPSKFPSDRTNESLVLIPLGEDDTLFLSFESTIKMMKFVEGAMKSLRCQDGDAFFENSGSVRYYKQLKTEIDELSRPH